MATGLPIQDEVSKNHLRKQLSVAVRDIQWSYAIFWSLSTKQHGVLEWGDGYYNGDIKTRKTMQPMELNVDKLGLKRSEQLRDLFESLSVGESNQQTRRHSASLSPEDLSDAEWYYLVCMSFTFKTGIGLPGRALASNQHIWLCNVHYADSKVFSRSLLAKSASIQTVICFPFFGGVIELGSTELVMEDVNLLQHIKTIFLEYPMPICSEKSLSSPRNTDKDEDPVCTEIDHEVLDTLDNTNPLIECGIQTEGDSQIFPFSIPPYIPKEEIDFDLNGIAELHANLCEQLRSDSPNDSSNGCEPNQCTEDSFMLEGVNGGASQVQSWQFIDDLSNCIHGSIDSSDCISKTFLNPEKPISHPKQGSVNNLRDFQECDKSKFSSLDLGTDDVHYTRTLSVVLKNSNRLMTAPCSHSCNHKSSFASWKKGGFVISRKPPIGTSQKNMLKKILFDVAGMHSRCSLKSEKENDSTDGLFRPEGDDIGVSHFLSERKARVNEQFHVLRSLVRSDKSDRASILGDTIEYVKDLARRVEELESCRELVEVETKGRRKHPDVAERTSDNYCNGEVAAVKKPPMHKRKACDIDEDPEREWDLPKDKLATVTISINDNDATIKIHCPWRESLLLDIMQETRNLRLDAHSVQTSTSDGILFLTLRTKFRGVGPMSPGMIKLAILRVIETDTSAFPSDGVGNVHASDIFLSPCPHGLSTDASFGDSIPFMRVLQ